MTFSPKEAARAAGLPVSTIRGWLQHSAFSFGEHRPNGRIEFNLADVRALAIMAEMVRFGVAPARAGKLAEKVVAKAGAPPGVAVVSRDHADAMVIPVAFAWPKAMNSMLVVPLGPLFAEIDRRLALADAA
ncbi:MAG: MerR family regulatory protein [Microvirga sp.]|nr:MerR family regulatory protein [Microvirga sp.]